MSTSHYVGLWDRPGYIPSSAVFEKFDRSKIVHAEHNVSEAEFARRHQVMREFMDRHGLDCLLIGGSDDVWNRGFNSWRWVTNQLGCEYSHYEYVVFPRQGDIAIVTLPMYAIEPARRARTFVEDVRSTFDFGGTSAQVIKDRGYAAGRIGIVEVAMEPSIPLNHWKALTSELQKAEFEFVTEKWWLEVRLIKSAEEIEFLERAAHIGDKMMEAVASNITEGMTEADVFAWMHYAMLHHGGEIPTMVLAVSYSMYEHSPTVVRETPLVRTLKKGDVILTEVAPRYPDGSECQTGRTFIIGEPTDEYANMIEIMWDTKKKVLEQLRPGRTPEDLREAVASAAKAGYIMPAPIIHSDLGGGIDAQPRVHSYTKFAQHQSKFILQAGMAVTPETYITTPDMGKGVYSLDTHIIEENGPRCLHKFPQKVVIL